MSSMTDRPVFLPRSGGRVRGGRPVRKVRGRRRCVVVGIILAWMVAGTAAAQPGTAPAPEAARPLALKEQMVRDRFERFRDRVYRLQEQLAETEPENAARLARALGREGELQLADRLDEIVRLLNDPAALPMAVDAQLKWMADADRLLGILLERDSANEERQKDIERLEAYRREVRRLMQEEQLARDKAAQAAAAQRLAHQLRQALERVNDLAQQQGRMAPDAAGRPKEGDAQAAPGDAAAQQDIARQAEQLADDLKHLAESPPEESADSDAAQEARAKTGEASESVRDSAKAMSQAGASMSGEQGADGAQQQAAESALEEAREKLEEALRALEEQSKAQDQAGAQRDISRDTGNLAEQMRKDAGEQPTSGQQGQQGQEGQQGQQGQKDQQGEQGQQGEQDQQHQQGQEGQQGQQGQKGKQGKSGKSGAQSQSGEKLDQAQQEMDDAAESLEDDDPEKATKSQDRAIEQLEQTQQQLEELLNQLRKEERAETLRDLEARFREMLSKQRGVNSATIEVDGVGRENFKRAEELQVADLAVRQRVLADQASACEHILGEEGTTIAFPYVVGQVARDMGAAADRLTELKTGTLTQTIQQEIVDTLEQLLEAVKKMQQENEQGGGGGQSAGGENQGLLPESAELKLLRSSQFRVNQRTLVIETSRAEDADDQESIAQALQAVADRQGECALIAREIRDRKNVP